MHVGTKASRFHDTDLLPALFHDVFVQFVCQFRVSCAVERGAVTLVAISVQRELRDNQQLAADILDGEVRLAIFVGKDAQ